MKNKNYTETVALAHKVVILADREMELGRPNPTCGRTCYKLAVALLHAETVRRQNDPALQGPSPFPRD